MGEETTAMRANGIHGLCVAIVTFGFLTLGGWEASAIEERAGAPAAPVKGDAPPRRIVSINACTDQLVFALAGRDQIAALTHYAAREDYSIYTSEIAASGVRLIQGNAEEVLKLKPDLVVAGTFTRRATRALLQRHGVRLELFPPDDTVEDSIEAIRRAASLFGREGRGEAIVAQIEQALAEAPRFEASPPSVLQLQRRGFVSGPETLVGDILAKMRVGNAAAAIGIVGVGRSSLEAALKAKADALVLFDPLASAPDQGAAMLLHPALVKAYPPERRIVLPGRLAICGGPALPLAIKAFADGFRRLPARISRR